MNRLQSFSFWFCTIGLVVLLGCGRGEHAGEYAGEYAGEHAGGSSTGEHDAGETVGVPSSAEATATVQRSESVSELRDFDTNDVVEAEGFPDDFEAALANFGKIKLKDAAGKTRYSLKPKEDGAKLVDGNENEVARYKASSAKLRIKDENDATLAHIIFANPHFHIEDAEQKERLWKFQRQDDGDWKLEARNVDLVHMVKKRDYGYEVEDGKNVSRFKAKRKGDKTSLRDASDQTILSTKDELSVLAMACLGLEAIPDERVRHGLAVAVQMQEGK